MAEEPRPPTPDEDQRPEETPDAETPDAETPEQRRRRLAAVFGEVLPEATSDDRDEPGTGEAGDPDRWLRDQVPPHHGD